MPVLNGSWQGSSYQARIICTYSVTYTSDHTQAIYAISFAVEFGGSISDSVNTWAVSGDCGSASGSNVSYSIPSGGGTKTFRTGETAQKYGDATVAGSIDNVEAVGGGQILSSFTLESGALAPYFTDGTYAADTITSTSARLIGWVATGNGGTLNNLQVQYNTSASATGATTVTHGSYATSKTITGLAPNTTYYARVRFSNNTYGYGAYGGWASFHTGSGLPGAPAESWSISSTEQDTVTVIGVSVPDNGGSAIDGILFRVNTTPSFTGYTDTYVGANVVGASINGLTPGTTYYMCLYAHNANGYSAPTAWKSFTTKEGAWVQVAGVWKPAVCYVNVGGVWKIALRYVAVSNGAGGVNWKQ